MTIDNRPRIVLTGASLVLMMVALYMVFIFVPTEKTMGNIQRIFYFHVPAAWLSLLGYMVVFVCSILYLWKKDPRFDLVAAAAADVGLVFATVFPITGAIWAKPVWGVYWTWDPRLTTALILWFIYVAYHTVRSYASDQQRGMQFAAVIGVVGFVDIPLVALSTTLWRTQHPGVLVFEGGLDPSMTLTLMVALTAYTLLFATLMVIALSMKRTEGEIKQLRRRILDR